MLSSKHISRFLTEFSAELVELAGQCNSTALILQQPNFIGTTSLVWDVYEQFAVV
jgi:hypothetical protein